MTEQSAEQHLAGVDKQSVEQDDAALDDVQLEKVKSMMDEQKQLIRELQSAQQDPSQSEMVALQARLQAAQLTFAELSTTLEKEQQARANIIKNIS